MIKLKDSIRNELAARFSIHPEELTYLAGGREDSDGIVYTYIQNGKKYVLKIGCKENKQDIAYALQKLELADYLGQCDICVGRPLKSSDGNVYQILEDDAHIYLASVMNFIDGFCPKTEQLTDKVLKNWGRLTGKMHAAVKKYPVYKTLAGSSFAYGWEEELDFFYNWCRNETVKAKWLEMKKTLAGLEVSRDSYGFIHCDNHQNNIILTGDQITLIDFDCAACNFFAHDILVPIQGPLFDTIGGFNRPVHSIDAARHFYSCFLSGYEAENHIEDKWLRKLDLFLSYRRLLLYTVMQDWMESDTNVRTGFISMIENPCEFNIM